MTLPIYQHPTMTVLVDDSPNFLDSLRFQLGPAFPSIGFSDTAAAIAWLENRPPAAAEALMPGPFHARAAYPPRISDWMVARVLVCAAASALWTTRSAPSTSGCVLFGVANVLSTTSRAPASWAMRASAGRSASSS